MFVDLNWFEIAFGRNQQNGDVACGGLDIIVSDEIPS